MQLILASQSPGRREVLEAAGLEFQVEPSSYEEDMSLNLPPPELAVHLSQGKSKDVAKHHTDAVVLGADSFAVANDGTLLGKPHTEERAKEMLRSLSGTWHSFITGYTIINCKTGESFSDSVTTKVFFKELSDAEIKDYISSENILEKAAAYNIQGNGHKLVERIEGDLDNVKGLPLERILEKLDEMQIQIRYNNR